LPGQARQRQSNENRSASPSPAADPPAGNQQDDAGCARDNAVLDVGMRHACFMSGKETRQLVCGENEIEAGRDQEQDADKHKSDFHGLTLARWLTGLSLNQIQAILLMAERMNPVRMTGKLHD
jgi:hypothetical protein